MIIHSILKMLKIQNNRIKVQTEFMNIKKTDSFSFISLRTKKNEK